MGSISRRLSRLARAYAGHLADRIPLPDGLSWPEWRSEDPEIARIVEELEADLRARGLTPDWDDAERSAASGERQGARFRKTEDATRRSSGAERARQRRRRSESEPGSGPRASTAASDDLRRAYSILGVTSHTPREEIKRRWKAAIRENHPDRVPSGDKEGQRRATARCQEFIWAYRVVESSAWRD